MDYPDTPSANDASPVASSARASDVFPTSSTGPLQSADELAAAAPVAEGERDAAVDRLIERAVRGAHEAIDGLAAKVSAKVDGAGNGMSRIAGAKDEWVDSARGAIRERPFSAVAVALLIGAAWVGLSSRRRA